MAGQCQRRRILVTGSAGVTGWYVCRELAARGHFVRGFDRHPTRDSAHADEFIVADLTDAGAIQRAAEGVDAIVHLGACPEDADFLSVLLPSNIIGLYNVCEAARIQKVKRLVLTSTVQLVWTFEKFGKEMIGLEDGVRPSNHYNLSKLYAEQMGRLYAGEHGLSVIVIRPGWLPRDARLAEKIKASKETWGVYLSGPDAGRAYACCVEADASKVGGWAVVFASSRCGGMPGLDLEPIRRISGFEPQDTYPDHLLAHLAEESS